MARGRRITLAIVPVVAALALATFAQPASAAITSSVYAAGLLEITGEEGSDTIVVTCAGGNVKINGADPDTGPFNCSAITGILVHSLQSADTIDLSAVAKADFPISVRPVVYSESGNDSVTASPIGSRMYGGTQNDTLVGLGGDDDLDGEDGYDTLIGGAGNDKLETSVFGATVLRDWEIVDSVTDTDSLSSVENASISAFGSGYYDGLQFTGPQNVWVETSGPVTLGPNDDTAILTWHPAPKTFSVDAGAGTDTIEIHVLGDATLTPTHYADNVTTATLASIEKATLLMDAGSPTFGEVDATAWTKPIVFDNNSSWAAFFYGGTARDVATGGPSNDVLRGYGGSDRLFGKAGNDFLYGGKGRSDYCLGGPGNDHIPECETGKA